MATSGWRAGIRLRASAHRSGLPDHLEVVGGLEQHAQARAHDLMVVEEEHTDVIGPI